MKLIKSVLFIFALGGVLGITGCEKKGPMENAGEQIDEAVEKTGEAAKEAGEEIKDAVEK